MTASTHSPIGARERRPRCKRGAALSGATGRLIAGVLFAVDEMELEAINERQAAGIAAAKVKGVYKKNGDRRLGFRKAKDKVLKLHEKGHSPTAIARVCGVARSTVMGI